MAGKQSKPPATPKPPTPPAPKQGGIFPMKTPPPFSKKGK